ncbi:hypothetical protein [Psychrobacillus sp. MER TA 171]|uniref:hypothetical protein n=1 Tax=Psychrobacillus sp. MER TA 171 TaxID=2939577 RepID=UPI002040BC1E|nr:hypothetical protein [Psychrobacillus sp. MER TA 171]MCM3358114.1 hypothetical protein [Psychrobacillus sp. MER TA 171]
MSANINKSFEWDEQSEDIVKRVVNQKNLVSLSTLISEKTISTIGIKNGYFKAEPSLTFELVSFELVDGPSMRPRIEGKHLLLDLWFKAPTMNNPGVLRERMVDGQRQVLLTIVIINIDFISTKYKRYTW